MIGCQRQGCLHLLASLCAISQFRFAQGCFHLPLSGRFFLVIAFSRINGTAGKFERLAVPPVVSLGVGCDGQKIILRASFSSGPGHLPFHFRSIALKKSQSIHVTVKVGAFCLSCHCFLVERLRFVEMIRGHVKANEICVVVAGIGRETQRFLGVFNRLVVRTGVRFDES